MGFIRSRSMGSAKDGGGMKDRRLLNRFIIKCRPENVKVRICLKDGSEIIKTCVRYEWNAQTGTLVLFKGNPLAAKQKFKGMILHICEVQ